MTGVFNGLVQFELVHLVQAGSLPFRLRQIRPDWRFHLTYDRILKIVKWKILNVQMFNETEITFL